MTPTDSHVLVVRDFILGACCTNCVRLLRKEPDFDVLIANALTTRPEPEHAYRPAVKCGPIHITGSNLTREELEAAIVEAIRIPRGRVAEPARDERIVSTLAAAVLLIAGIVVGFGLDRLVVWVLR